MDYEQTEHFVSDSSALHQFCRLYLEKASDDTILIRWANVIGPETIVALNDRAVELARSLKVTRGRKLFPHRYGHFAPQTSTKSELTGPQYRPLGRCQNRHLTDAPGCATN